MPLVFTLQQLVRFSQLPLTNLTSAKTSTLTLIDNLIFSAWGLVLVMDVLLLMV
jgi:hypothetical protein